MKSISFSYTSPETMYPKVHKGLYFPSLLFCTAEGYRFVLFCYRILFLVNEIVDISLNSCSFFLLLLSFDIIPCELHDSQRIWTDSVKNDCFTMVQSWNKIFILKKRWPPLLDGFEVQNALIYIVKKRNNTIKAILPITINSTTIGYVFILKIAFCQ